MPLIVIGKKLTKAADEENLKLQLEAWEHGEKSLMAQLDTLRAEQQQVANDMGPLGKQVQDADDRINEIANKLQLAKYKAGRGGTVVTEDQEAQAAILEQQKKDADDAMGAIIAKKKADEHHNSVLDYLAIAKTLGPRGIRGQAMKKGLDALDKHLQEVCDDNRMGACVAGRAIRRLLRSQGCRAMQREREVDRAIFAACGAVSRTLGDRHLIADGADILDANHRRPLEKPGQRASHEGRLPHNLRHGRPALR